MASVYWDSNGDSWIENVVFTYKVGDSYFGGTFTPFWGEHVSGTKIRVWYDPEHPERNNLVQRQKLLNWIYLALFVLFGLFFLYSLLRR